jgi:hypothetical protein
LEVAFYMGSEPTVGTLVSTLAAATLIIPFVEMLKFSNNIFFSKETICEGK